jgi:HD superfamily phosphohydrolase
VEVRDPIHGSIPIQDVEIAIIEHPFFQRLRNIKQLGFSEYVFPGATHTRYLHSIGVSHTATKIFEHLFKGFKKSPQLKKLAETTRLAALLHDIGHAPLSHSTEVVMPPKKELKLPKPFNNQEKKKANHEDYTIKAIIDSSFTASFKGVTEEDGVKPEAIACLIKGENHLDSYFKLDGVDYFPLLHQLISSELDCDRMDYLLRDSYFCGVSYGKFDLDWIIDNLSIAVEKDQAYLGLSERAVSTFDDFLLSRFHMFLMVYFHYRAVCLEQMMYRYFSSEDNLYHIPSDIEQYQEHDDHYLYKVLRQSKNQWAQKIVQNKIPSKIFEVFGDNQKDKFKMLLQLFKQNDVDYILCESKGRLSKYYGEERADKFSIKVVSPYQQKNTKKLTNIHEATDLFEKYSKHHYVARIHADRAEFNSKINKEIDKIIGR